MDRTDKADWRSRLADFVSDLGTGEDRVPLERVLRRHRGAFEAVLATGRTWPQIAQALTTAGARHRRGQPISAKQIRTVFARIKTRDISTTPMPAIGAVGTIHTEQATDGAVEKPRLGARNGTQVKAALPAKSGTNNLIEKLAEARRARKICKLEFDE